MIPYKKPHNYLFPLIIDDTIQKATQLSVSIDNCVAKSRMVLKKSTSIKVLYLILYYEKSDLSSHVK